MTDFIHIPRLMTETFGGSRSEARRKIVQGAVKLNGEAITAIDAPAAMLNGELQVGKRSAVDLVDGVVRDVRPRKYDSIPDTRAHIERVQYRLKQMGDALWARGVEHDRSKLEEPELSIFDEYTPKLKASTYGSDEYHAMRESMSGALVHHYANNRHHPEHWPNGVLDMSLIDLMEMLADWKAATERMDNGNLAYSIIHNEERFDMPEWLTNMLHKTAEELGWL